MLNPSDDRFRITVRDVDASANDKDKLAALVGEGPLQVSTLHVLAKALPEVVVKGDGEEGTCNATQHVLEYLFLPHARIAPALKTKPVLWAVKDTRLARWLVACEQAGVSWEAGDVDTLSARIKAANIEDEERMLGLDDVYLGEELDDLDCDNYTHWITAAKLMAGDSTAEVVAQFKMVVNCHYTEKDRGEEPFLSLVGQALGSLPTSREGASEYAQAAEVARWFRATRPPTALTFYMDPDDAADELSRRAAPEEEARFRPLFERGWKRYKALERLWVEPAEGARIAELTKALAGSLGEGTALTASTVEALCDALDDYTGHLEAADASTNTERAKAVKKAFKELDKRPGGTGRRGRAGRT